MLINKKMFIIKPKKCYLLLDFNIDMYAHADIYGDAAPNTSDISPNDISIYNGPIKIFTSLRELNDALAETSTIDITDTEDKLFKGYLYPAKEFPLEYKESDVIFVIEKVDTGVCFIEQVSTPEAACDSIKNEISSDEKVDENVQISDYLIFIGKNLPISYCCYDFKGENK